MMRSLLAKTLFRLADWLRPKAHALRPGRLAVDAARRFIDAYRRNRSPTPNEILAELKNTAWTCASLNAAVCASFPPRLYVITQPNQPRPKCLTKALPPRRRATPALAPHLPPAPRRPPASRK